MTRFARNLAVCAAWGERQLRGVGVVLRLANAGMIEHD